jgi:hypothetical protein
MNCNLYRAQKKLRPEKAEDQVPETVRQPVEDIKARMHVPAEE